ncbi:MAG: prolipoprotein diacylglyceryl transferase [Bacteroidia bacterium]|nr:prolipoprotein diacylglyceryl transferase [Bacteroidia bacterium]
MYILNYIVWDIKPEIFTIGEWGLRYYSILFASGFVIGWYIVQYFFKTENIPLNELDSLSMHMILGTLIGARLGHVIFYEPRFFWHNPLEILMLWHGGLSSHGTSLGLLVALYLFTRKSTKKSYLWTLDRAVIPVALAAVLIRTGNLMNSEIYGIRTDVSWGFIFIRAGETVPRHPTQIYEALVYFVTFIVLMFIYIRTKGAFPKGLVFGIFLIGIFATRFFIEFLKKNQVGFEENMLLNMGQILSIPFTFVGIYLIIMALKNKRKAVI